MAMDTCIDQCGLTILDTIPSWTIPKLGANVDVTSTIETLNIIQRDTLSSFMVRCSNCDREIRDAGVTVNPNQLFRRIIKILNNCPQVMSYITTTIAEFYNHIQQYPNKEYQYYPVTFMLQKLRMSGIDMSMSIAAPSNCYGAPQSFSPDTRLPSRPPFSTDSTNYHRQHPDRLEKGDKRRVSFNSPTTASMNVYDVEDELLEMNSFSQKLTNLSTKQKIMTPKRQYGRLCRK